MDTKGISKLDLKRRNRRQILIAIREAGTLARVDIAGRLALTRAAVTIITNQMIQQNILEEFNSAKEDPTLPKKKGRKKTLIRINPDYKFVLGAVISEDYISVGLCNLGGEVLDKTFLPLTGSIEKPEIVAFIVQSCKELISQKSSLNPKQILGLGVGIVPQRWEQMQGEEGEHGVTFPKLCYLLEMELGIPVQCGSAVGLYGLANTDFRSPDSGNQLLIYSGKEYHTAVITNNFLNTEYNTDSKAINRYIITPGGLPAKGYPDGSVFAELSKGVLIARGAEILGRPADEVRMSDIHDAYRAGDKQIKKLLDSTADKLALLVYNIAVLHGSKRVILQSFEMIPETEKRMRTLVKKLGKADAEPIELLISPLDPEHSFLAGGCLAVEKLFFETGGMLHNEPAAGGYN